MRKVIIIGCGYAGVVAAWRLKAQRKHIEVVVFDRSKNFNFLPLLPDALGRQIPASALAYPIEKLSKAYGFNFINEEVISLDLENNQVLTVARSLGYDYLLIASGSETNFYGNDLIKNNAYKLDDALDAEKIFNTLKQREFASYLISGGGYTGIEVATNLRVFLNKSKKHDRVIIVERAPSILGPLPEWMKKYVWENLKNLDIEVLTDTTIQKIEAGDVYLSSGAILKNSMLIWAAGVKTSGFLENLNVEKNPQGRIKVDQYLRLKKNCFVIGDAAYFQYQGNFLRMAVQFAIAEASVAVDNITRSINGEPLREFKPRDLGYIIPMANNKACGIVLGKNTSGLISTCAHYLMSIYRSYGFQNKIRIMKSLIKGG